MPQCEPLNTYRMSHVTFIASKNVKFRLSRNLTKFNAVTRLHENIPTVKSVSSSEIYKNTRFFAEITILPFFRKCKIFSGFTVVLHVFIFFCCWGPLVHSLGIVQWYSTRRDHPGNPGRVSGSGPVNEHTHDRPII